MAKEIEEKNVTKVKETEELSRGTLKMGEPHPLAYSAKAWIMKNIPYFKLLEYQGILSSVALSGNRSSEVCVETLGRLLTGMPVSDRYLLGLAWMLRNLEEEKS